MVDKQGEGARGQPATSAWSVPEGRRTDEWSQCVVRVAEHRDRAAFAKFFSHFAPLIKAFALSGSSLSAAHADELVQEVMLKVWTFNLSQNFVLFCKDSLKRGLLYSPNFR